MTDKAAEVFAVPELLETIFLQLPPKDLLLAQGVNTTFRDVIKNSIQIQRSLFYASLPVTNGEAEPKPRINPLIDRIFRLEDQRVSLGQRDCVCINTPQNKRSLAEPYHLHINAFDDTSRLTSS